MNIRAFAVSLSLLLLPGFVFAQSCKGENPLVGSAYMSDSINWSQTPDFQFTVTGAPPNVCGDLATIRNGSCLYTPGWICTDANGNFVSRSWKWVDTLADQTDTNIHFNWPNGTATYFTTGHVWDKTCPSVTISIASPTSDSFTGTAEDNPWGAGFDASWTKVKLQFSDITGTSIYWDGTSYNPSVPALAFDGSVSPLPSHNVNWSATSVPPASAHIPGHKYLWQVHFYDGDDQCSIIVKDSTFTY